MKVEFYRPDDPTEVVGVSRWDGRTAGVEAADQDVRFAIDRVFRPTPVVVDDPSLRPLGARGESVVHPSSLDWFRAAAITRSREEGLRVRFVPEVRTPGGWDPASAYRTFRQAVARLEEGVD
jgi:hypothetical protein